MTAGLALEGGGPFATFNGSLSGNSGSGTWQDVYGCAGTWELTKTSVSNNPPDRPTLISPANGASTISPTPTLITSSFSDPDSGDTHYQTEWQISTDSGFSTLTLQITSSTELIYLTVPQFVLAGGTTYYWRVRFYDNNGNVSDWSSTFSFTTLSTTTDQNGNGIPDNLENNTVDLDGDGTADSQQADIKSLNTLVGQGQMGVSRRDDPIVTSIDSIDSINPDNISATARPSRMTLGLISIRLTVANPGDTATVTVYFSQAAPTGSTWFMHDPVNGWVDYSAHATFASDLKSVSLELKDGGFGDADGLANGTIVDPGGFGVASWIQGTVTDASTSQPISGALVSISDMSLQTLSNGQYQSLILPGTYTVGVDAGGYQSASRGGVEISEGELEDQDFSLSTAGGGTPGSGSVALSRLNMSHGGSIPVGASVTFSAVASNSGGGDVYYRFHLIPNYGTGSYDPNSSQMLQDFSTSNSCTHTFDQEGSYIMVLFVSDTAGFLTDPDAPLFGGSLTVGGEGVVNMSRFERSPSGPVQVGSGVTFTAGAVASGGGDIYYRFHLIPDYGTSSYDANNSQMLQDFSTSTSCTHTFTEAGSYIVVVFGSNTSAFLPVSAVPIIGGAITIE
jgi:hypothetical protein